MRAQAKTNPRTLGAGICERFDWFDWGAIFSSTYSNGSSPQTVDEFTPTAFGRI
jgi:hypothetical protein